MRSIDVKAGLVPHNQAWTLQVRYACSCEVWYEYTYVSLHCAPHGYLVPPEVPEAVTTACKWAVWKAKKPRTVQQNEILIVHHWYIGIYTSQHSWVMKAISEYETECKSWQLCLAKKEGHAGNCLNIMSRRHYDSKCMAMGSTTVCHVSDTYPTRWKSLYLNPLHHRYGANI